MKYTKTVHNAEPDYTRPVFKIQGDGRKKILSRLSGIYGKKTAELCMPEIERILKVYYAHKPQNMIESHSSYDPENRFTQEDMILITYGDLIRGKEKSPLATLASFCDTFLKGTINTLHLLPFFPYSSDRGFSIIDFTTVDPALGTWEDIEALEGRYQLMFDGVINHVSSKSHWFQEFLNGAPYYKDFFAAFDSKDELSAEDRSKIFRPRTSDILVKFDTIDGPKFVWATFSKDQIDLNFKNPEVLLRVLDILLLYVRRGADIIRLDAVTYLWEEPGTRCIHLKETHEIVKLFRCILDIVAPGVAIITETNVPHKENVSYFGNGRDEAHMVYNFALPPLVLYTFYREDASLLSKWAEGLVPPSKATTFFNFLDSHDGVGLLGAKNIIPETEIEFMIQKAKAHGGLISYKAGENGKEEPYEINITWYSALNGEGTDKNIDVKIKRFIASRAVALVLKGVPGIYLHSLIGTENDLQAVLKTNSKRDINRKTVSADELYRALDDPGSKVSRINKGLGTLLSIRSKKRAFHPNGEQKILNLSKFVFSVLRTSPEQDQHIISLINITGKKQELEISLSACGIDDTEKEWTDLITSVKRKTHKDKISLSLNPYDVVWLQPVF